MTRITRALLFLAIFVCPLVALKAQTPPATQAPAAQRANLLRGQYGPYRANNDLLFYHLDVRIDPETRTISGKNTIRFKMLNGDTRIQLDLFANLAVDRIELAGTTSAPPTPLTYYRDAK